MQKEFEKDLSSCSEWLQGNGIILYPTDTVWGLGCDATNEVAVQRIMALKNRPENKSFVVLVKNEQQLQLYVNNLDPKVLNYLRTVRKPTTVIYPDVRGLAPSVTAADGSAAIRICPDAFCQALLEKLNIPLLSTSANYSGQPTPAVFSETDPGIQKGVDYVVHYRRDDLQRVPPSTIIKWEKATAEGDNGHIHVIRP